MTNIEAHRSRCQFLIRPENSDAGRVKISPQNLLILAAQRV